MYKKELDIRDIGDNMFITQSKKIGSCYYEFQLCKSDFPVIKNKTNLDIINHWLSDSLLISADDFYNFYQSYSAIFNCAVLANGEKGFDFYGPNYYDKNTSEKILNQLENEIDKKYYNLILWLKKEVKEYNGFYILGI